MDEKRDWEFEFVLDGKFTSHGFLRNMTHDEADKILDDFIGVCEKLSISVGGGFSEVEATDGAKE